MRILAVLNGKERRAFSLHLIYAIIEGVVLGVFALNEFVFIKGMKGTDFQLAYLLQFSVLVLFLSIFINEFIKRFRNTKKLIRASALVTHAPLLLIGLFPVTREAYEHSAIYHHLFLAAFFMYYLNKVIALPKINLMLKSVYQHDNFGKLYSWASSFNKAAMLITSLVFGFLLDMDNFAFVYVYPVMGVLGIVSFFQLSLIKFEDPEKKFAQGPLDSVVSSLKRTLRILKTNKAYLHFEMGFMFYGFAWMVSAVMIAIYFNEVFEMNYKSYSLYKNIYYNLLAIFMLPYFGKLIGRIDPRRFGAITFAALALHIFFLGTAEFWNQSIDVWGFTLYPTLLVSYSFYGVFAATMALLWFIGSAYFCKKEEVADYQSVHLTLTGFRAILSFHIGIVLYHQIGFFNTFVISVASLLIAIVLMIWSQRRIELVKQQ